MMMTLILISIIIIIIRAGGTRCAPGPPGWPYGRGCGTAHRSLPFRGRNFS